MKKYIIALSLTALASASFAAMGTGLGLPLSWTTGTTDRGYGTGKAFARNNYSSMCVECHTVNPSQTIMGIADNGALTFDNTITVNGGSHFVVNKAVNAALFGQTKTGGSNNRGTRTAGQYLRGGAWANGGLSKFGLGTALTSVNEGDTANGYDATKADMICESCHSLTENVSNGADINTGDNDLLLGVHQDNIKDNLCTGCHAQSETAAGRYTTFHSNGNLQNFDASNSKYHHVLTGDNIQPGVDYPDLSTRRWAPSFSTILGPTWCTTGKFNIAQRGSSAYNPFPATTNPVFRGECNISGTGTRLYTDVPALGDINPQAQNNSINCSNCHRPHNARTNSGAHILRLGDTTAGDFTGEVPARTGDFANDMYKGIKRQGDTLAGKVYGEYRALCLGCHIGY